MEIDGQIDERARQLLKDITGEGKTKAEQMTQILAEQEKQKKDIVAPTEGMRMRVQTEHNGDPLESGKLMLDFREITPNSPELSFDTHSMPLTDWGHRQVAEKTGIPIRYYDRMQEEAKALLAANVNTWIDNKEHRFIRTLDGKVRAILSDRYLVLDHLKAIHSAANKAKELGAVMADYQLTDTRLYVKMIVPHETWQIRQGDHHVRGIVISNSEVGAGSFKAESFVMRLICKNGMIGMDKLARVHLGSQMEPGLFVSDRTRELEAEIVASKLQDIVEGTFDRQKFDAWMEQYRGTTDVKLNNSAESVKNVVKNFKIPENQEQNLLNSLISEGDPTQYGLINALTSHAQTVENGLKIEIEKVAGELSMMPEKQFEKVINVPAAVA